MPRLSRARHRNEHGIALVAIALAMLAIFAVVAVGIDVARLSFTASEVQGAADVAATAADGALLNGRTPSQDVATLLGSNHNTIDGRSAATALDSSPDLETGTVDASGTFTPVTGAAANSIRATTVATVDNLFAGVFGPTNQRTTITKTAIATLATIAQGSPELPIAVSGACFDNANCSAGSCPTLSTQANTAGWTGYSPGANDSTIRGFIPSASGCTGGGASGPSLAVQNSISLTNGTLANAFKALQCLFCANPSREYLVTVVDTPCGGNFTGTGNVTGFATVKIDHFVDQHGNTVGCSGNPKGIVLQSLRRVRDTGAVGGCAKCGSGMVRLIG